MRELANLKKLISTARRYRGPAAVEIMIALSADYGDWDRGDLSAEKISPLPEVGC
jgi:hypothetical protein